MNRAGHMRTTLTALCLFLASPTLAQDERCAGGDGPIYMCSASALDSESCEALGLDTAGLSQDELRSLWAAHEDFVWYDEETGCFYLD